MKHYRILLLLFLIQPVFAQTKLPVIKATSQRVAINDGGYLDKNAWSLSPKIKPDVFTADRTRKTKWVTFYTDIDSIKVKVKPGTRFNFVVVLNGKDSCYTQIASAIPPDNPVKNGVATHDTIPFNLTSYNAIAVKAIVNGTDTLTIHFDTGSWDFRLTKDAILKKTKLLSNQPGALSGNAVPDYNNLNKVFKIQMGRLVWNSPEVGVTTITAHEMDGRFGWNLFEGKSVEIDYDKSIIVIHSKLPKGLKGYAKSKLDFKNSFVIAKGSFKKGDKIYPGDFLMDTGADQAVILDSAWATNRNFAADLKLIKTTVLRNPRGVKFEIKIVLAPLLNVNGFALSNIPASILGGKNPAGFEINNFGNDLLKRFNMILDFKNDCLYLQPNKLMGAKYRDGA
ncbi:MAG: hypothetical protein ABJA76_19110 [Mucilaginibacter sp.]